MFRVLIVAGIIATLHIPRPMLASDYISHPERWTVGLHIPVWVYASPEWHGPVLATLDRFAAAGYVFDVIEVAGEIEPCPFVEYGIVYCSAALDASWQGVSTPTIAEDPLATAIRVTFNRSAYLDPSRLDPQYFTDLAAHETSHALGYGHADMTSTGMPAALASVADAATSPGKAPSRDDRLGYGSAAIITGRLAEKP